MTPSVAELAKHPDMLNKDTVFALREMVARYPYYQAARILFLKNLFLLHDVTFGEELRKASIFIGDRRVLFNMVEGDNYKLHADRATQEEVMDKTMTTGADRTESLIDRFLQNGMLAEDKDEEELPRRKKPTVADATNDYMAFLMQEEAAESESTPAENDAAVALGSDNAAANRSDVLISNFIDSSSERIVLQDNPTLRPEIPAETTEDDADDEDYFTETLAKIYIKQGRYEKAMEIIRKLNLNYPKKNRYFADQMRFLHKLVINQKHNNR